MFLRKEITPKAEFFWGVKGGKAWENGKMKSKTENPCTFLNLLATISSNF